MKLAWLAFTSCLASAQPALRFEVASVKPSRGVSSGTGTVQFLPGGRLLAENAVLGFIIQNAYRVKPYQILGAPAWIDTDRFGIEAKASGNASADQMQRMLQSLLEDRFQLQTRRESRTLPVYELTFARDASKLQGVNKAVCTPTDPNAPLLPPAPGETPQFPCGRFIMRITPSAVRLDGRQVSLSDLAQRLSNLLGRTVIDKTAHPGLVDVHLEFSKDQSLAGVPGMVGPGEPPKPPPDADFAGASIFAVLQEQVGLKLGAAKDPVEVLIIEHVARPAEN